MNILFMVPYTPNLIRVRSYNLIRELTRQGHQVTLATLWTDDSEREDAARLEKLLHHIELAHLTSWRSYWNCLVALPTSSPLQAVYSWQPDLARNIDDLFAKSNLNGSIDVVHVEHMRGARYGLRIKKQYPEVPVVWDSVDCITLLFEKASWQSTRAINRWITSFELRRNRAYEGWLPNQFARTLVTSRIDQDALVELSGVTNGDLSKIVVLPNGVDLEYFKPDGDMAREDDTLVVSGKMSYHANVTMVMNLARKIMPKVWAARANVKLWIVGKDPTPDVKSLAQDPRITVTGTVDDIRPYLQRATIAVSPVIYGVGIQNKVLEAMACGTPVISSPQAISTLSAVAGRDVLVAEDPEKFALHVLGLLDSPQMRNETGVSGLNYVRTHHQWSAIVGKLVGVYEEAIIERKHSFNPPKA